MQRRHVFLLLFVFFPQHMISTVKQLEIEMKDMFEIYLHDEVKKFVMYQQMIIENKKDITL